MLTLDTHRTPYDKFRPRPFFPERKKMIKQDISLGNGGKKYNPEWSKNKTSSNKSDIAYNSEKQEFMQLLPWALFATMALISLLLAL
ncbi:MAG TPA: hypothetical protein PKC30_02320 [Saprospiraceae bacterium]|nr:hypothetical protein [Saprospiraceae bacterium]